MKFTSSLPTKQYQGACGLLVNKIEHSGMKRYRSEQKYHGNKNSRGAGHSNEVVDDVE